jgi:hypothetical protein
MFILIPLGFVMLAAVIYLAVSKKSTFKIRIAALIALAVMLLSVMVSIFVIFFGVGAAKPEGPLLPFVDPSPEPVKTGNNFLVLVGFILFMIALFVVVFVMSIREQRKSGDS